MTDYSRVKRNVAKMIGLGAPEREIDQYIASEGVTAAQLRGQSAKPKSPTPTQPAPKTRPPLSAYASTPTTPRPAPVKPRPVLPVQSELLAPMRAMGDRKSTRLNYSH